MPTHRLLALAGLSSEELASIGRMLKEPAGRRGRKSACSLRRRVLIACAALRTNLTVRELAAVVSLSKSTVHRIVAALIPMLADLARPPAHPDRREAWIVDGTLVPTRDHVRAAKSKNYRWSCNAQIQVRWRDRIVVASSAGGPGNRNDPFHYRGSVVEALCLEHRRFASQIFAGTESSVTAPGAITAAFAPGSNASSLASGPP